MMINRVFSIALIMCLFSLSVQAEMESPYGDKYPEKVKKQISKLGHIDPNGDGLITQTEFLNNAKKQFNDMNYNQDDFVDFEEMKRYRAEKREEAKARRAEIKKKQEEKRSKIIDPNKAQ